jgi:hypothetical protein
MMVAHRAAISTSAAGVKARTSTASGMIERKKTITFGLPSVSDIEPRKARQPREGAGAASPTTAGAVAILHATKRR